MQNVKVEILRQLFGAEDYLSGERLSKDLSVSRAYIWKTIKELGADGFVIDGVSNKGYKLMVCPDKLYGYYIASKLDAAFIGANSIKSYETLDSTNNRAYRLAEDAVAEGLLVVAESQTSGKGRAGREWVSPENVGLYFSIVLKPKLHIEKIPSVTLVAALSIIQAIKDKFGLEFQIKWPNDILFRGKKVCGILSEIKAEPDKVDFLVLGIGINVNTEEKDLPENGDSLKVILDRHIERVPLLADILKKFEDNYNTYKTQGFESLIGKVKENMVTLDQDVIIEESDSKNIVRAIDIDSRGALIIEESNGTKRSVYSGDVHLIKD